MWLSMDEFRRKGLWASELGVGRRSVRRALDVLETGGFGFTATRERGTFIDTRPRRRRRAGGSQWCSSRAAARGRVLAPLWTVCARLQPIPSRSSRCGLATEPVMAPPRGPCGASQSEIKRLQMLAAKTRRGPATPETYERADSLFHRNHCGSGQKHLVFSRSSTPLRASQRDVGCGGASARMRHCYKRQSAYATFHEAIAAAIAARNGQEAYAADAAPISATCSNSSTSRLSPRSDAPQ